MINRIKTGVFSGSFNPIHIGHLALANYLCEYEGLDEVWFIVSPLNPFKASANLLAEDKRLELVEIATLEYPHFQASGVELTLPRPSYTVNTLEYLKDTHPEREFVLVVGSDNWNFFDKWKDSNRIIARNKIIIYPRPGYPVDRFSLTNTIRVVKAPLLDISATFIRESLAANKDIRYFLHPEVYKKIKAEGLYSNSHP